MRYISTMAIYEQVSFNEGVGQNILNWIREKWRKLIEWIKSIKDKIFKPKEAVVESKIKQLEDMANSTGQKLDDNVDPTPDPNRSTRYNSSNSNVSNKTNNINSSPNGDFSNSNPNTPTSASIIKNINDLPKLIKKPITITSFIDLKNLRIYTNNIILYYLENPYQEVITDLKSYITICISNNLTPEQWKQNLNEVKKIIAKNGNFKFKYEEDENRYTSGTLKITQATDDDVINDYSDSTKHSPEEYAYGPNNDKLHDAMFKRMGIKREAKTYTMDLGSLIREARSYLRELKEYREGSEKLMHEFLGYEMAIKRCKENQDAIEIVKLVFDYVNKCYVEAINRTKTVISAEMDELNRILDLAINQATKYVGESAIVSCNIRIV